MLISSSPNACIFLLYETIQFLNAFDRAMNALDNSFPFLASTKQIVSSASEEDKVRLLPIFHVFLPFLLHATTIISRWYFVKT